MLTGRLTLQPQAHPCPNRALPDRAAAPDAPGDHGWTSFRRGCIKDSTRPSGWVHQVREGPLETFRRQRTLEPAVAEGLAGQPYDVFLSHDGVDGDVVERIARRLVDRGVRPWLDRWQILPGDSFQHELEDALATVHTCAFFVGAKGLAGWARQERQLALNRRRQDPAFAVFAVLLPDAPDPLHAADLGFLGNYSWVDLRGTVEEVGDLVAAVRGTAPGPQGTPAEPLACPYKGLNQFAFEDSKLFFGRETDVQQTVELLRRGRFLAVTGPSGSGKSSLVRAGLLPALSAGALPGSDAWERHVITPGRRPLSSLTMAMLAYTPDVSPVALLAELADIRTLDLRTRGAEAADGRRRLLFVDQFEEVFTRCDDDEERRLFLDNLVEASTSGDGSIVIVIAMRSDFYSRVAAYPDFARQLAGRQHLVTALSRGQLEAAIAQPAHLAGGEFDPGLVGRIAEDTVGRPGALPLLQFALEQLWTRRQGRRLTHRAYDTIEGVDGALAQRAEETYCELTKPQQQIVQTWFLELVQVVDDIVVSSSAPSSRFVDSNDSASALLESLVAGRLLTTTTDDTGTPTVALAHEAVIEAWERLREWIADSRDFLQWRRRFSEDVHGWDQRGRPTHELYSSDQLRDALQRVDNARIALDPDEDAFLRAATRHERFQVLRRYFGQAAAGSFGTSLGLASALALLSTSPLCPPVTARALQLHAMATAPTTALVGLVIGLGLMLTRGRQPGGLAIGAVTGGSGGAAAYTWMVTTVSNADVTAATVMTGALLGLPVGAAVGAARRKRWRTGLAVPGAVAAMLLASQLGQLGCADEAQQALPLVLVAGLVYGLCTGLGFAAGHVDDADREWIWGAT